MGDDTIMPPASTSAAPKVSNVNLLEDLFGSPAEKTTNGPTKSSALLDLLGDAPSTVAPKTDSLLDLGFSIDNQKPPPVAAVQKSTEYTVYDHLGLSILMTPQRDIAQSHVVNIHCKFVNKSGNEIQNLNLQVAVPKSQKLQLQPASSTILSPSDIVTQQLRILNPNKAPIKLRLKVCYDTALGDRVEKVQDYSGFPSEIK